MKLYSYFRSSAAYRVRIALNLKQLPYETVPVHLLRNGGEQHMAEYLAINPQGLVPALVIDDLVVTQSTAIIEYLEERFSDPALLPESLVERAHVRSLVQTIACDIHPLNNLRVLQYLERTLKTPEKTKMDWYHHWLGKGFDAIETVLEDAESEQFCFHNQVTMADVYLIPQVYNALRFQFDMIPFPIINRIYHHCIGLSAFRDAAPEQQPDAE